MIAAVDRDSTRGGSRNCPSVANSLFVGLMRLRASEFVALWTAGSGLYSSGFVGVGDQKKNYLGSKNNLSLGGSKKLIWDQKII